MAFDPPAIENTEAGDTIEGGPHAARSRGFHWWLRCIQPDVDTRSHQPSDLHVIVFEVCDFDVALERFFDLHDALNDFLSFVVSGMSFAGINHLERADFRRDRLHSFDVDKK